MDRSASKQGLMWKKTTNWNLNPILRSSSDSQKMWSKQDHTTMEVLAGDAVLLYFCVVQHVAVVTTRNTCIDHMLVV